MDENIRNLAAQLARDLTDDGKLIEAGWMTYRYLVMQAAAPQIQIDECRMAFFAGAQHLFGSILALVSEGGRDATPKDLERMSQIDAELKAFVAVFSAKHGLGL